MTPQQRSLVDEFVNKPMTEEKAQKIADVCNKAGITKSQLEKLMKK